MWPIRVLTSDWLMENKGEQLVILGIAIFIYIILAFFMGGLPGA